MHIKLNRISLAVVSALALTAVSTRQANAQFAVFDANSFATQVKSLSTEVKNGATLTQELATATKILNQSMQMYSLAMQETTFIKNKNILMAAGFLAQNAQLPGHADWDKALSAAGGVASSAGVWQQMMAPGTSAMSRMMMADSFAAAALNSIGSCNQAALGNDAALSRLEQMSIDMNPSANTRANQANLANMSSTQILRVQECQHNLQLQQAKLQLLAVQQQRTQDQQIADKATATTAAMNQLSTADTANAVKNYSDR